MSDSQNATDIVHSALHALHEQGVHFHASNDTLARLAETVGQKSTALPARTAPQQDDTRPKHDLRAAFQAQMSTAPAAARTTASHTPARAASPFTEVANATTLAPSTGAKAERLAAMRGPVLTCTKCPHLLKTRTQVVFGVGNPDAELMFVGEAPGADVDLVGEPFVGQAATGRTSTAFRSCPLFTPPTCCATNRSRKNATSGKTCSPCWKNSATPSAPNNAHSSSRAAE